ncbi:MAG: hypothetical protein RIT28_3527, partial [Pseudomonadota bacterium]
GAVNPLTGEILDAITETVTRPK